jgi:hypothetical protein
MTVEHVHVHPGDQAVVGVVESPRVTNESKSSEIKNDRQLTHAPQPAMRRPNAEGELVPITRDAERPMSDARRKIPGGSEGQ